MTSVNALQTSGFALPGEIKDLKLQQEIKKNLPLKGENDLVKSYSNIFEVEKTLKDGRVLSFTLEDINKKDLENLGLKDFIENGSLTSIQLDKDLDGNWEYNFQYNEGVLESKFIDKNSDGNYEEQYLYNKDGKENLKVSYEYNENEDILSKRYDYFNESHDTKSIYYNYDKDGMMISSYEDNGSDGTIEKIRLVDKNDEYSLIEMPEGIKIQDIESILNNKDKQNQ